MRKCLGMLLALAMLFSAPVTAFAGETASDAQIAVSLSTIEQIMTQYSPSIRTVVNNLRIAKDNYDDAQDSDYAKTQYKMAKTLYDQNVQNQVFSAKRKYINYCVDSVQLTASQVSANSETEKLRLCAAKQASGYLSQKEYQDQLEKSDQSKSDLEALRSKLIREKADLKTLLNVPSGISLNIQPMTLEDMEIGDVSSINYSEDEILMLNRSATIIAAGLQYDYDDDAALSNASEDNAKITYDQTKDTQKATFKALYDALTASWDTFRQDEAKAKRAASDLELEKQKLSLGYSSQQSVDNANLASLLAQAMAAKDKSKLYTDYLSYENMKNGYSATGSSMT